MITRVVIYPNFLNKCVDFFLFTLGTIDIFCLVYSNFCTNKIDFEVRKLSFTDFIFFSKFIDN